jgi:mannose-1-phosphate guanylyltransferase
VTGALEPRNIVVQPRNRGTGNGILLPILHIVNRDPEARILILPSDHYIGSEAVLVSRMQRAARALERLSREIVLLGIAPEEPDPELGYIAPGAADGTGMHRVHRFVEKPEAALARALLDQGGVWNSFIMAGRAQAFLDIFAARFPEVVMAMVGALQADAEGWASGGLRDLYDDLPDIDFSKHVITGHESRLRLLPVPVCGWSDLGTPERVARCLERLPAPMPRRQPESRRPVFVPAFLDLADAHLRMQVSA